jgi:hypothetical protein
VSFQPCVHHEHVVVQLVCLHCHHTTNLSVYMHMYMDMRVFPLFLYNFLSHTYTPTLSSRPMPASPRHAVQAPPAHYRGGRLLQSRLTAVAIRL